jgi:DNA-3-methyladenine glycosylase I
MKKPYYLAYHDEEWGVPVHNDLLHFEFLVLESAQAGLSWDTVLRKRENYRKAFDQFDPLLVAKYDQNKIELLLQDAGIIRNKLKIKSAIGNAQVFLELQEEFGSFNDYVWRFVGGKPIINTWKSM